MPLEVNQDDICLYPKDKLIDWLISVTKKTK